LLRQLAALGKNPYRGGKIISLIMYEIK